MVIALILAAALAQSAVGAQAAADTHSPAGTTTDLTIPPGANFDKAEFRSHLQTHGRGAGDRRARPGIERRRPSDGGRAFWQEFATRHLALVACRSPASRTINPSSSTTSMCRRGGRRCSTRSLDSPERTRHGELACAAAAVGASRRRRVQLTSSWRLRACSPSTGRRRPVGSRQRAACTRSRDRGSRGGSLRRGVEAPRPIADDAGRSKSGRRGPEGANLQPAADARRQTERTAWLPSLAVAKAWQAVVTGQPFEP